MSIVSFKNVKMCDIKIVALKLINDTLKTKN